MSREKDFTDIQHLADEHLNGDAEELIYPQSLVSYIVVSLMCHVLLIALTMGHEPKAGQKPASGNRLIVASLHERTPNNGEAAHEQQAQAQVQGASPEIPSPPPSWLQANQRDKPNATELKRRWVERGATYIPGEFLDIKPHVTGSYRELLKPELILGENGKLVVRLLVDSEGHVDSAIVETSELTEEGTQRFVKAIEAMQISPGLLDGKTVKSVLRLSLDLQNGVAAQSMP